MPNYTVQNVATNTFANKKYHTIFNLKSFTDFLNPRVSLLRVRVPLG